MMQIEEINIPDCTDCSAAYRVAGCIIENFDGEYRVWSIGREPELLLEHGESFAMAIAVACSTDTEKGE
ncbi:hypothetical protein JJQ28_10810 [Enterobacter asburiae]|uniref:hypothetical protein n=1 Tax=Enterobacter asburiae TaxID=61645 RepID=UPI00107210C5|nr:hypothetical protein [Enterobacter asburiae]EKT1909956.1 hypothetical protein [Escherichia coli]MBK4466428.1 hypothetical protein [Enterobacter asburiae]MBK4572244.1 hypothetical protein [Enterobacter asburiae]HBM9259669.1 hypothetical protein [Citrobacter freundii]